MIKILFFAQLREQLQCNEICISENDAQTVAGAHEFLIQKNPHWATYLANKQLITAVNQSIVKASCSIKSGDELAFFPPVTGG
jgi:molybdopterin converting factor subunit 1